MDMLPKDKVEAPPDAIFYVGLFLSWAISALLSLFFVIWSANMTIVLSAIAANLFSLVAAVAVGSRHKKRLAFVVAYTPTLLLGSSLFVLGLSHGMLPRFTWW